MAETKLGRQTPTRSLVLPYRETLGQETVDLYNSTGRSAQEWQALLLYDLLAVNEDGLFVHTKFGYAVPRRIGKNEVAAMRELWGLQKGEHILHTAHRTTTSRSAWERLKALLDDAGIVHKDAGALGQEKIVVKETGGRIDFRTRSGKGIEPIRSPNEREYEKKRERDPPALPCAERLLANRSMP